MNRINWNQFELKNPNPQNSFETMCRNIFLRTYKISSHSFSANYNQAGLETEPVLFDGKYYGFQCKYSASGNGDALYAEVLKSLKKAVAAYPHLNTAIIYTNLDIKPNVSQEDLQKTKKSNRVKIHELGQTNNLEILWFVKPNFETVLNEIGNYDLYRSFFSPEDTLGLLKCALTYDERTFLVSDQFMDLSLNGSKFSDVKEEILSKGDCIITGAAGTGKSEILKSLYLQSENQYLTSINQSTPNNDTPIPVFVRLRECVNGNLEELLRNRLKDFDINVSNSQNHYRYFFDGLDEVSSLDFGAVLNCLARLKGQVSTKTIILTSRLNTPNLTMALRDFKPTVYTVDPLEGSDVDEYFKRLNNPKKQEKLQTLKDSQIPIFEDVTDIFSAVLLSENIFQIDSSTTKVDLISANAEKLVESNCKYSLINLPEPKILCVERILSRVSELMQRTGNISVSRIDLQAIIGELFPGCNYLQVDQIIDFISEIFFDSVATQFSQNRYSYRHKRYFEFYLYSAIKDVFYENPAILRELRLLSNKDFILNIFLVQELKNNILSNNVERVFVLRFFETYLGESYMQNIENSWFMPKSLLISGDDSYLQSRELREYLCTKQVEELQQFLKNDPLSIKGFLSADNYYSFVKEYHKANGIDIRAMLGELYDIQDEWLQKAAGKDQTAFWYCRCVIDQIPISKLFDAIDFSVNISTADLDYYPYSQNGATTVVDFYELAIESFGDWLISSIYSFNTQQLEILSYVLLRPRYLRVLLKDSGLSGIASAICDRVTACDTEPFRLHTIVLYGVLTGTIIQKDDVQARADKVNKNHLESWRANLELNSYIAMILGEEFRAYHYDYKLGIALRQIVHGYYPDRKGEILSAILREVNKYNLVHRNWFSYYNAVFIGESVASLDINSAEVKTFILELRKFDSVVSTFQVLYTIMRRNSELFKSIANPSLIASEYVKACRQLSYYDHNTDLAFMYATMISRFDLTKADALFESAINNSIFRPIFRKEDMLDYHLPNCLLTAYNNYWFSTDELENALKRTRSILKTAKDTLDSGADGAYFKYLVESCCPQLSDIVQDIKVNAENLERPMGWESYSSTAHIEGLTIDNLAQYYKCEVDGVNYSSISVWRELIGFELENDNELTILYQTLADNYYPVSVFNKMSSCFHIITAVLISDVKTKQNAIKFIMEHAGRMGLINLIKAYALVGNDQGGRRLLEQLIRLCESMVYPSAEYVGKAKKHNHQADKIIEIICNSEITDWDENSEMCIMHYIPDPKIVIKWDQYEDHEPFNEEWATKHPDKNAKSTHYYVCYEDNIIKTLDMVWVDGSRALIPVPDYTTKHINRKNYNIGRLVNCNLDNYNGYIVRSGLIVD